MCLQEGGGPCPPPFTLFKQQSQGTPRSFLGLGQEAVMTGAFKWGP